MEDVVTYIYPQPSVSAIKGPRRIRFVVYPVKEGGAWSQQGYALDLTSDGSRDTLGMTVAVEKTSQGVPNITTVIINNLSENTREMLTLRGLKATIYIADPYVDSFQELYTGGILSCVTERSGTEIVTTIQILKDIRTLMCSAFAVSKDKARLKDVLKPIKEALKLKKVTIYGTIGDRIVEKFYHMGTPMDGLNKLAFQESFSWSIDSEDLTIVGDGETTGNVVELSPDNGLISAVPILSGPFYAQNGVAIRAYPVPWLQPFDKIKVKSQINAKTVNRDDLRVNVLRFNLSTIQPQWEMQALCYIQNPAVYKEA